MTAPRIGHPLPEQGGTYCGLVRGAEGQPDQHLIAAATLPGKPLTWKQAKAWAKALRDGGFDDWTLPHRGAEGWIVCAAGVAEKRWHWLDEKEGADFAWICYFGYGGQSYNRQGAEGGAVAVRRFTAQSFDPSGAA